MGDGADYGDYLEKNKRIAELEAQAEKQPYCSLYWERQHALRCEHCGASCRKDCSVCGAPWCCPQCCKITTFEARVEELEVQIAEQEQYRRRRELELSEALDRAETAEADNAKLRVAGEALEKAINEYLKSTDNSVQVLNLYNARRNARLAARGVGDDGHNR